MWKHAERLQAFNGEAPSIGPQHLNIRPPPASDRETFPFFFLFLRTCLEKSRWNIALQLSNWVDRGGRRNKKESVHQVYSRLSFT
jgi:hypothetical protein